MTNSTAEKGARLRLIIEHTDLTQKKFAEKIGISATYLTGIVNGFKDLSGGVLEAIAIKYGQTYNIGWLITGQGAMLSGETPAIPEEKQGFDVESKVSDLEARVKRLEALLPGITGPGGSI